MMEKLRICLVFGVVLLLTACAGTNFVRPDSSTLRNGQTQAKEIVEKFGKPFSNGSVLKNGKTLKTSTYAYASVGGKAHSEGVTPARAAGFYFLDDILVGHEFTSSFEEDHTAFDETKLQNIKKGVTTKSEVLSLMGTPNGRHIYPLIKANEGEGLVYLYGEARGFKISQKQAVITIDSSDIVTDVEFTSTSP